MDGKKLENARCNIDRINSQIVSLLVERMNYVDQVAEYKAAKGLPIFVPEREQMILDKVAQLAGAEYAEDILPVFKAIFATSCQREERKIKQGEKL